MGRGQIFLLTNTIFVRIIYRMKVTALIPDELVNEVKHYSSGKNITDSLIIALQEWISLKKIIELNQKISNNPLEFRKNFSAEEVRELNRR
jgi:hypothetical protein